MNAAHVVTIGILLGSGLVAVFCFLSLALDRRLNLPFGVRMILCLACIIVLAVILLIGMSVIGIRIAPP